MNKTICLTIISYMLISLNFAYGNTGAWSEQQTAKLSFKQCTSFPNRKVIERSIGAETFELFYYSNLPISPAKKYVLFIDGGPGNVAGLSPIQLDQFSKNFNIIRFHIRGAGCSQLPLSEAYDKFLTTDQVIEDVEAIRKDLKIEQWDVVYGESYGSQVGHIYAHKYPTRIKQLFHEALVSSKEFMTTEAQLSIKLYTIEMLLRTYVLDDQELVDTIVGMINSFYTDLAPYVGGETGVLINRLFENPEYIQMAPILDAGAGFFMALYYANYSGFAPNNETNMMMGQSIAISIASEFVQGFQQEHIDQANMFLEQGYRMSHLWTPPQGDFLSPMSSRVAKMVRANDGEYRPSLYKHAVPTFLIQGGADAVTPADGALDYIQTSLTGEKYLLLVTGGGHKDNLPEGCSGQIIQKVLEGNLDSIKSLFDDGGVCFVHYGVEHIVE